MSRRSSALESQEQTDGTTTRRRTNRAAEVKAIKVRSLEADGLEHRKQRPVLTERQRLLKAPSIREAHHKDERMARGAEDHESEYEVPRTSSSPVRCAQRVFPSIEALGKENMRMLNGRQPLRLLTSVEHPTEASASGHGVAVANSFSGSRHFPTRSSISTTTGSGKVNDVRLPAYPVAQAALDGTAAGGSSKVTLRPVREPPRVGAGRYSSSMSLPNKYSPKHAGSGSHMAERHRLNMTWPSTDKVAWADTDVPGGDRLSSALTHTALSASAPSLTADRIDEMFGHGNKMSKGRNQLHSGSAMKKGEKLALSLPSVVQLPSIAEESANVAANKKHGTGGRQTGTELERRPSKKPNKKTRKKTSEELAHTEEHEFRKLRKATHQAPRHKPKRESSETKAPHADSKKRGQLNNFLPELTTSTPYLTAVGVSKIKEDLDPDARRACLPAQFAAHGMADSSSVNAVDPCIIVSSDSDLEALFDLED